MLVHIFVPLPTYPVKVEKAHLSYFLKQVRRYARSYTALLILSTVLIHLILWLIITPEILRVYPLLGLKEPSYLSHSFMMIPPLLGLGLLAYLLLLDPLKSDEVKELTESPSELLDIKDSLINATVTTFPIIYMAFTIMFLILTLIIPIYNINFLI